MYNSDNDNVKNFLERHFMGFQWIFVKDKRTFMKKAVVHTTTLMHCKARQVSHDLFSSDQWNGSDMVFVAWATKVNIKNLKTWRH